MKKEFIRFKLAKWRTLVGILQILGGLGLVIGVFLSNTLVVISAGGLALLMLMGFVTRLYIKDSVIASSPAFIFTVLNALLVYMYSTT
ncbi:DoxX family protein [Leeuwenhoekiella sp. NPDC079379]|uniref:DoxX family protein n=1 Tax=Leeuwenhoekiella sp. NPDC079379 TaxID=3364122 RepID=UPI0037C8A96A